MLLPTVDLGFDPDTEFQEAFAEAARLVGEVLDVAPLSPEYSKRTTVLYRVADILDRLFKAWSSPEELQRVAQLREGSDAFARNFSGDAARGLLEVAGFERQETTDSDTQPDKGAVWVFQYEEARARLHAMSVRLCLQKVADLQKLRGTLRWVQASNASVVPKASDGKLTELLTMYRMEKSSVPLPADPSARERSVEASVRVKMNERREAAGCRQTLLYHEGLTAAARSIAYAQRLHVRTKGGDSRPKKPLDAEVQEKLSRVPLPPGFDAAHLHFTSDELPHVFGLTDTRGGAGGGGGGDDTDTAAELLAREAVGFWAARQSGDVVWPYAAVCGVGVALDYTVNRGFMVVFLIGYEGMTPDENSSEQCSELRRRREKGSVSAALPKSQSFGARVQTLDASSAKGFSHRK